MTTDRPIHKKYGKATTGRANIVDGVTFYPYRRGVGSFIRCSSDGRIGIWNAGRNGMVYKCRVDDTPLPKNFRKFETAARAGIAVIRALEC